MGVYRTRDGLMNVSALKLNQKRLKIDRYPYMLSSAVGLVRMTGVATAAVTLGTALDHPRALKFTNALTTTSERSMTMVIKGYDVQGNYTEEQVALATGTTDITAGNVAFGYVTEIVPAVATKGYGTYATLDVGMTDKIGLSEYCEDHTDIKQIDFYTAFTTTAAAPVHTATASPVTGTTFNKTYQTIDMSTLNIANLSVGIKYLSKFQTKNEK